MKTDRLRKTGKSTAIAKKLKLSVSFFSQLLSCQRNIADLPKAIHIAKPLNHKAPATIWLRGGGTSEQRRAACGLLGDCKP